MLYIWNAFPPSVLISIWRKTTSPFSVGRPGAYSIHYQIMVCPFTVTPQQTICQDAGGTMCQILDNVLDFAAGFGMNDIVISGGSTINQDNCFPWRSLWWFTRAKITWPFLVCWIDHVKVSGCLQEYLVWFYPRMSWWLSVKPTVGNGYWWNERDHIV